MESTYGDREHPHDGIRARNCADPEGSAPERRHVIIPAFAVGRTQELLFFLRKICDDHKLDMPCMWTASCRAGTQVYRRHREDFDEESQKMFARREDLDWPQLTTPPARMNPAR